MSKDSFQPLKKLTSKIGSGATPSGGQANYKKSGISLIRSQNVLDMSFSKDGLAYIDDLQAKKLNNVEVYENDVLINITGDSIARVCKVPIDILPARVNQHVSILRCNDLLDPGYLLYYLIYKKDYLLTISRVGGTRNALTKEAIEKLEIRIDKNQEKIAAVLSALDDKIELNNKINAELEAMAKTLYDYWFVQFDFPNSDGKPYKSSGGKMEYNTILKREIPEGWEVKRFGELVKSINTGLNPRDHFKLGYGDNFYITIKNIEYGIIKFDNSCDKIDDDSLERIQKRSNLEKGDILFTSIEPVGKTYLLHENPLNWNINESVFSLKPNLQLLTSEYLFMLASGDEMKFKCKNSSTGSIHKGIRITPLKEFIFCQPPFYLIERFTEKFRPILSKMDLNQKQNQELAQIRDWLLPMLMNGQVTVEGAYSSSETQTNIAAEAATAYQN